MRKLYLEQGGRESNRKIDEGVRARAIKLIKKRLDDFGPTLAKEKLEEYKEKKRSKGSSKKREKKELWRVAPGGWPPRLMIASRGGVRNAS
ncbi:MAG: hypothetical protein O3A58_00655 [Proteobacteria bacterium]|nr:hypothetical protein [Pseudomonadota bacterium]